MFKKPLNGIKTSAPLRASDRRKLKQRVVDSFAISSDDGDLLVPEGILSLKFTTHLNEPGTIYLAPGGDPLWFTIGKGSDDLIPTTYTLWKQSSLLPSLITPAAVIPFLVGGADLMIPGVIHFPPSLNQGQLVSIVKYIHHDDQPALSAPLAVGRMALSSDQLNDGRKEKGKAVFVFHTWKDHLWDMGSKPDAPDPTPITPNSGTDVPPENDNSVDPQEEAETSPPTEAVSNLSLTPSGPPPTATSPPYTPAEVSTLLHTSLLQAIAEAIPASAFPIPSTVFYTNHILPCRPAFPASVLPPSGSADPSPQDISIKASSHKSLTTFLKAAEKASILTLKAPQKHSQQPDLLILSVNASHPSVVGHRPYLTIKKAEEKAAKKAQNLQKEGEHQHGGGEIGVRELWKPHQASISLFEGMGGNLTALYTLAEVKALLNDYITSHSLVNPHEQAYINLDSLLVACLSTKSKGKSKAQDTAPEELDLEFMKRDELTRNILDKMQSWYEIKIEGRDVVQKKGALKPIQVVMKVRQGRKTSTLITGFEPFLVVNADDMAEELRKVCAGATSVSPVPGKPANSGLEVLVQGKQAKAVVEYLSVRGVPKKWIEVLDLGGKK